MEMEYPAIHECGTRHVHFMHAFCEYLSNLIGRPVPLAVNRPHLYLAPDEQKPLDAVRTDVPYCVINAGHKLDYTAKFASTAIWQEVVDYFRGRLQFVQVGEANPHHIHRPLEGVLNLIGKTTFREFFRLVRYSTVACGPVSFLMHTAAAFEVPYVCLAGGREEPSWAAYSTTQYLHTMGALDCCRTSRACWKSRTVPLKDGNRNDLSLCSLPVIQDDGEAVPKCLDMIGAAGVIRAIDQQLGGR
ncbi:ADP-heptose--LPS heptosyltransferase [Gemmata obscuriglobus]|uniref:ADP-heptose--LPS heptosyltransferase n=1 Tax=Gemmata obscuriglobus TaxID=114 RepID=A0A2Z3H182_9BACT|nr:ADP-heptose--LPS heptosyltransferase [Gemmata obscuriglobus]